MSCHCGSSTHPETDHSKLECGICGTPYHATVDHVPTPWPTAEVVMLPDIPRDDPRAEVFIQWKGTKVCLDFTCTCGADGHVDDYFAYVLKCPGCGKLFAMPSTVFPAEIASTDHRPVIPDDYL